MRAESPARGPVGTCRRELLFFKISCITTMLASGLSYSNVGAAQKMLHEIAIELPRPTAISMQPPIEIDISGRQRVRIDSSQHIIVELIDNQAPLTIYYNSGLRLDTVVRASDDVLEVPAVRLTRVAVLNAAGAGVSDASVYARGSAGRFGWTVKLITSNQGSVDLPYPASGGGPATVAVQADGFGPYLDQVEIRNSRDIEIRLKATAAVHGLITAITDTPNQVRLEAWELSGGRRRVLQRQITGAFDFDKLPSGEYEFAFVLAKAGIVKVAPVFLTPGSRVDLGALDVSTMASLSGDVRLASGAAASGVRIRLTAPGFSRGDEPEAITDASGHFAFARLLPGEYIPELYSKRVGWRVLLDQPVSVYNGKAVTRSFEFVRSDCALRIEFQRSGANRPENYLIDLPVTDPPVTTKVTKDWEERLYPSVPCSGVASVRRTEGSLTRYSVALEPGEVRLVVPTGEDRTMQDVRVTVGGKPVAGVSVSATARNSNEVVVRSRSQNSTDENGRVLLHLPQSDDLTLYLESGSLTSIIEHAGPWLLRGRLELDLPSRILHGSVRDSNGKPLARAGFSGNRLPDFADGHETGLPAGVVTVFKGVTNMDGTFEVGGLAHGRWAMHFSNNATEPPESQSREVAFPISPSAVYLDVSFAKR